MFQAPDKNLKAAGRYKALINARVGTKQNSYGEFHANAHYLFAQNKMGREQRSLLFLSTIWQKLKWVYQPSVHITK